MSSSFQSGLAGGAFPGMKKTASWLPDSKATTALTLSFFITVYQPETAKLRMAKEGSAFGVI